MKWALQPALLAFGLSAALDARADCTSPHHVASCIDADTFFPHAGPGPFFFTPAVAAPPGEQMSFGIVSTYLRRPIVLAVPGAAPEPSKLDAVGELVDTTFLFALGISDHAAIEVALPTTTYRTGAGVSALTSQHASALPATGLRDLRVGAAYELLPPGDGRLGLASRLELSLPTGDEASFAGDASFMGLPQLRRRARIGHLARRGGARRATAQARQSRRQPRSDRSSS